MKKIFVIILIALFIINIIAGAFLFLDIRILKAPIIAVELDPVTVTPNDLVIQATVHITNPNPFDVSVENFRVISTTKDGYEIGRFSIPEGTSLRIKTKPSSHKIVLDSAAMITRRYKTQSRPTSRSRCLASSKKPYRLN